MLRLRHLTSDLSVAQRRSAIALGLIAVVGTAASVSPTGATYTSQRANPSNAINAAYDWTAPTVAVTDPGTNLRGTVTLQATASDARSSIASVALQVAVEGTSTYVTVCTSTTAPHGCAWKTTAVADGRYKIRAVATDTAGNQATSAVVSGRVVDNTAPAARLGDPGSPLLAGDVVLTAAAEDATSGVATVTIQRSAAGAGRWTDVCTQTTAPYACTWSAVAGTYDLRALVTDAAGNQSVTPVVGGRQIINDTVRPTGTSVRTTNVAGGNAGRMEAGDTLTLRYSEPMLLSSIIPGWTTGTSPTFQARVGAGGWFATSHDTLSFVASGSGPTPNIGSIDLGSGNWLSVLASLRFTATATAAIVDGATELTITLGTRTGTGNLSAIGAVRLGWMPSDDATDLAGNAASTDGVLQSASGVAF